MSLTGGIVLYSVLWFLVLFVLLPFGQQSQADAGEVQRNAHHGYRHRADGNQAVLLHVQSTALDIDHDIAATPVRAFHVGLFKLLPRLQHRRLLGRKKDLLPAPERGEKTGEP